VIGETCFFWHVLGRKRPKVRFASEAFLGLLFLSGMAAIYGTVYYLIFRTYPCLC
jgi:hypothetical protein